MDRLTLIMPRTPTETAQKRLPSVQAGVNAGFCTRMRHAGTIT